MKKNSILVKFIGLLILVSLIFSLTACFTPAREVLGKDEIAANVASSSDKDYRNITDYFNGWGFPIYDTTEFSAVNTVFYYYYVEDLPSTFELAKSTAEIFLQEYYDELDLDDEDEVTIALIDSYIAAVGDNYAVYRTPDQYEDYSTDMSGRFCGIGITVEYSAKDETLLVISVMPDSPAQAAGFLPGDYVTAVEGVTLAEVGYDGIVNRIRGEEGTEVTVTVLRDGKAIDFTSTRAQLTETTVYYELLADNIAYIRITQFKDNTDEQFGEALAKAEADGANGIVFDLRQNPGGYLDAVLNALEYLVPIGTELASYEYMDTPYVFRAEREDKLDVPCTVLCDEYTASAGELFTSAVRDFGEMGLLTEKIVGVTTFGKGIMQSTYTLRSKSTLTLTIAYYFPPSRVNYHGEGVEPDVAVELSDDSDNQLDAAILHLKQLIGTKK